MSPAEIRKHATKAAREAAKRAGLKGPEARELVRRTVLETVLRVAR